MIPQQNREPEVVLLNTVLDNGLGCTLASIPLSGLAAGRSPTPNDCFQPSGSDPCTADFTWRSARALLRLDNVEAPGLPKRAAVATVGGLSQGYAYNRHVAGQKMVQGCP